jgi:Aminoglycoside-2''-adenylyltransferase
LRPFGRPWFVCGGWAIDLFLDEVTRPHEDLELGIYRDDQAALQSCLVGWELLKCERPGWLDPWEDEERLELPIHQVFARPPGSEPLQQPWEPGGDELQFFLNDVEGAVWVCRRDASVRRPVAEVCTRSASGLPIVVPEIQLLYKAKHHLEKDEHDFEATVPRLSLEQRAWLRQSLQVVHPGDPWLARLEAQDR